METLLLVDDDVSLLESLKIHFEDAEKDGQPRFQVVTATTAAAGPGGRAGGTPGAGDPGHDAPGPQRPGHHRGA